MITVVCPVCKDPFNVKYQLMEVTPRYYFECYCGKTISDMNRSFYGNLIDDKITDYCLWLKINEGTSSSLAFSAYNDSYVIAWGTFASMFKTKKIVPPEEALEILKKYVKLKAFT